MDHVSDTIAQLREDMVKARDNEISEASFVGSQYITDHNDRAAYAALDKQVNQLARAWDKMIARLEKWEAEALKIEQSCEGFYGDGD
jgi:wobble nucleotide-excising tRNase